MAPAARRAGCRGAPLFRECRGAVAYPAALGDRQPNDFRPDDGLLQVRAVKRRQIGNERGRLRPGPGRWRGGGGPLGWPPLLLPGASFLGGRSWRGRLDRRGWRRKSRRQGCESLFRLRRLGLHLGRSLHALYRDSGLYRSRALHGGSALRRLLARFDALRLGHLLQELPDQTRAAALAARRAAAAPRAVAGQRCAACQLWRR